MQHLANLRPARLLLTLVAASWLALSLWLALVPHRMSFGGLSGRFSDHASHMGSVEVARICGPCIWHTPVDQMLQRWPSKRWQELPPSVAAHIPAGGDIFAVPDGDGSLPIVGNWPSLVRPYPPGAQFLAAPAALALRYGVVGHEGAMKLLVWTYLTALHVGLAAAVASGLAVAGLAALVGAWTAWLTALHWTLEGFYDGALLLPLVLAARRLGQQRPVAAIAWYCLAFAVHFRATFFAPLVLGALLQLGRGQPLAALRAAPVTAGAAVLLALAGLVPFWLAWPSLHEFPLSNPLRGDSLWPNLVVFGTTATLAGWLWRSGWRHEALQALWLLAIAALVRQVQPWHPLTLSLWLLLPVLGDPTAPSGATSHVSAARWLQVATLTTVVYAAPALDIGWVAHLGW